MTTKESIEINVINLIKETACVSEVDVNKSFNDNGIDSLDIIEILMVVENEYNLELDDDEIAQYETVQQFLDKVVESVAQVA